MRRYLAIICALALLFSFSLFIGCSEDKTTEPDSSTPIANSPSAPAPSDNVDEYAWIKEIFGDDLADPAYTAEIYTRLQEGDIRVAFIALNISSNTIKLTAEGFEKFWTNLGAQSLGIFSAEGNMNTMGAQLENCTTMGVDLCALRGSDLPSLQSYAENAMAEGVKLMVGGEVSVENIGFTPAGMSTGNNYVSGYHNAKVISAYLDKFYPDIGEGEYKIATAELSAAQPTREVAEGFHAGVDEDPRMEIVFTVDAYFTIQEGYQAAEEALIYDPDIRCFFSFDEALSIGMNNYVVGNSELNADEFLTCCTSCSQDYIDLYNSGESIIRFILVNGDPNDPASAISICSYMVLLGLVEEPHLEYLGLWTINDFGWMPPADIAYISPRSFFEQYGITYNP